MVKRENQTKSRRSFRLVGKNKRLTSLLLATTLSASVFAQSSMPKISMNFKNEDLASALSRIEAATGYHAIFGFHDVENLKVTGTYKDLPFDQIINDLIKGKTLRAEFNAQKKTILLTTRMVENTKTRLVTGKVVDGNHEPLPGVTIVAIGIPMAVTTDLNGNYELELPANTSATIEYSFIGMQKQRKEIGAKFKGQELPLVIMKDDSKQLGEVVVTGY